MIRARIGLRGLSVAMVLVAAASAGQPQTPRVNVTRLCVVKPNGDMDVSCEMVLTVKMYSELKRSVTDTGMLLSHMGMSDQSAETKDINAHYEDDRHAVTVTCKVLGGAKNRGAKWFVPILRGEKYTVADTHADSIALMLIDKLDDGTMLVGTTRMRFPAGTKNTRYDRGRGRVVAEMPPPAGPAGGRVDLAMDLKVRGDLMTCLYKVYGNPKFDQLWVAKAVFRNAGAATLRDLRVRFRIRGYSDWSEWKRNHFVYPTQTVCEAFFPILSHEVRKLTSATPTALDVEWSYRKPDGTVASESETRRVTLLGLNDVMYSSRKFRETMTWHERFDLSPVIGAAYVSHTDPIMQRYAGMATRVARGVAASRSDHEAQRFMRAVYDLMWFHKIQYQSPPWMFKEGVRQHVKYGRDVLRNRAGTCIDLAILYASVCKAGGLDALLGQVPRHVFPIIRLPSGALQAVEATCIGGDRFGRKTSYEAACRSADKTLAKWRQDGRLYLIDVGKLRARGIPPPELPDLPPSALGDWGIKFPPDGAIPEDRLDTRTVKATSGLPSITVPKSWRVSTEAYAVTATYTLGRVTVMARSSPKRSRTVDEFADAMEAQWKRLPGWKKTKHVTGYKVAGKPAIYITATSRAAGTDMVHDYYLTVNNNQQHTLAVSCAKEYYPRWKPAFSDAYKWWKVPDVKQAAAPPVRPGETKVVKAESDLPSITVPKDWTARTEKYAVIASDPAGRATATARSLPKRYQTVKAFADAIEAEWARQPQWNRIGRWDTLKVAGNQTVQIDATFVKGGVKMKANHYLVVNKNQQHTLVCVCPEADYARFESAFDGVYKFWRIPDEVTDTKVAKAASGLPSITVPANWDAQTERYAVIVSHRPGRVRIEARSAPKRHQTVEQLTTAMEAQWKREPGWKRTGYWDSARVAGNKTITIHATYAAADGTTMMAEYCLVLNANQQHTLIMTCPQADYSRYESVFGVVFKWWHIPDARPGAAPEPVGETKTAKAASGLPSLTVPKSWVVRAEPYAVTASHPTAPAFVAVRSEPKGPTGLEGFADAMETQWKRQGGWTRAKREGGCRVAERPAIMITANSKAGGKAMWNVHYVVLNDRQQHWFHFQCPSGEWDRWKPAYSEAFKWWKIPEGAQQAGAGPQVEMKVISATGGRPSMPVPKDWRARTDAILATASKPDGSASAMAISSRKRFPSLQAYADKITANRQRIGQWDYQVAGHKAIKVQSASKLFGQEIMNEDYFVFSDGKQHGLYLSCRKADYARWRPVFEQIFKQWRIPEEPGRGRVVPPAGGEMKTIAATGGRPSIPVPKDWRERADRISCHAASPDGSVSASVISVPKRFPTLGKFADTVTAGRQRLGQENYLVAGYKAIKVRSSSRLGGLEIMHEDYFAFSDGQQHVLYMMCRKSDYARWRPTFEKIFKAWRIPGGGAARRPAPPEGEMKVVKATSGLPSIPVPKDWDAPRPQAHQIMAIRRGELVSAIAASSPKGFQDVGAFADAMEAKWKRTNEGWRRIGRWNCKIAGQKGIMIQASTRIGDKEFTNDYYLGMARTHQSMLLMSCEKDKYPRWEKTFEKIFVGWRVP